MDLELIKKIIKVFDSSQLSELEIEEGEFKIRLNKNKFVSQALPPQAAFQISADSQKPIEETQSVKREDKKTSGHEIKSPMVGTFYCAPSPEAEPYIKVGDKVSVGKTLCIIEAMKLMNEIESDVNGKIAQILVKNGQPVEYGQTLFIVETE